MYAKTADSQKSILTKFSITEKTEKVWKMWYFIPFLLLFKPSYIEKQENAKQNILWSFNP